MPKGPVPLGLPPVRALEVLEGDLAPTDTARDPEGPLPDLAWSRASAGHSVLLSKPSTQRTLKTTLRGGNDYSHYR